MTTQQKLVQKKLTLLELGEYLQNVSEASAKVAAPANTSTISRQLTRVKDWMV